MKRIKDLVLFTLTRKNIFKMEGEYAVRLSSKVKQNKSLQSKTSISKENVNTSNIATKNNKSTSKRQQSSLSIIKK